MTEATTVEEVVITGKRTHWGDGAPFDPNPSPVEQNDGTNETPQEGGEPIPDPNEETKDCAAAGFKGKLNSQYPYTHNSREYFSFTYSQGGRIYSHDPRPGTGTVDKFPNAGMTPSDIAAAMTEFGISAGQILALVHNHPHDVYVTGPSLSERLEQTRLNAFPSSADWDWATDLVGLDATLAANLVLYVLGPDGQTRAFPFSQMETFKTAVTQGDQPPAGISPSGCTANPA